MKAQCDLNNTVERYIGLIVNSRNAKRFSKGQDGAHASAAWDSIVEAAKVHCRIWILKIWIS